MLKSQLSNFLRKAHLISLADRIRFLIQKFKYSKANNAFKKKHPEFILPPEYFVYETYLLNFNAYYNDGRDSAKEIIDLLSKYFTLTDNDTRILDWGCGPARIVRNFPEILPQAKIYGTDYNEKYIQWCKTNLHNIHFSVNGITPPMDFSDSFFNVIIGLSIFTHLSESGHAHWINELHRVTQKDGGLLITTQGQAFYTKLTEAEKVFFDDGKLVVRKYTNEGNRLYSAFQPLSYMKELFEGKFQISEFIPGEMLNGYSSQDTWVLKKI
jgi:ubiquinone/menaquinone biosynthesis C-methylase UbiE